VKVEIQYSSHFARAFKKLPPELQKIAVEREGVFRKNIFDPSLKTHQLGGGLKGFYSFSVTYKYRILFEIGRNGKFVRLRS